jgi:hypothetical protein
VLLKETLFGDAIRTAHETERPLCDMRQDMIGNRKVVIDHIAFGDFLRRKLNPVRMRHAHARDLFRSVVCNPCARRAARGRRLAFPLIARFGFGALHRFRLRHLDLLDDVRRGFVGAQALERALSHQIVMRPAAEFDFGDQFRFDEFRTPRNIARHVGNGRRLARKLLEFLAERLKSSARVAGAHAPRIMQFAVAAHGEQDR